MGADSWLVDARYKAPVVLFCSKFHERTLRRTTDAFHSLVTIIIIIIIILIIIIVRLGLLLSVA